MLERLVDSYRASTQVRPNFVSHGKLSLSRGRGRRANSRGSTVVVGNIGIDGIDTANAACSPVRANKRHGARQFTHLFAVAKFDVSLDNATVIHHCR